MPEATRLAGTVPWSASIPDGPALRARALGDRLRPQYHFTAPAGWLNDPNGVCQWDGTYHLFYQYNPYFAGHHQICWGHATSTDLVRWTDRPIALRPSRGPDQHGCWSGVLVNDGGRPVIVYSGNHAGTQTACLAVGDATLSTWRKDPANPVIAPPESVPLTAFRDHCVWREDGGWRQLIGSGIRGEGGAAFLYASDDLREWRLIGPLVVGDAQAVPDLDPLWTGTMWECVDFFRLRADGSTAAPDDESEEPHVLIFSAWDAGRTMHPLVATGRYVQSRFEIEGYQRLDLGGRHAYAPQSFVDEQGRRILWSWMQEARDLETQLQACWSGAMALPRVLRLDKHGLIRQAPVPELEAARGAELTWDGDERGWTSSGVQIEFAFEATVPMGAEVQIDLLASPGGEEHTSAVLRRDREGALSIEVDRSRSSLGAADLDRSAHYGLVPYSAERVGVRGFVDRSSVELFVDGVALTTRVYPTRADAREIRVLPEGGARVGDLAGWHMQSQEPPARAVQPRE